MYKKNELISKYFFSILFFFISIATILAQNKKGTIHVEKSKEKFIIKPCICGQTDTLFINRKDLLNKKPLHLELCGGKNNILKYTVMRFNSSVSKGTLICLNCSDNRIDGWFYDAIRISPKSSTIIIKDVQYNTGNGVATLPSVLYVMLTD